MKMIDGSIPVARTIPASSTPKSSGLCIPWIGSGSSNGGGDSNNNTCASRGLDTSKYMRSLSLSIESSNEHTWCRTKRREGDLQYRQAPSTTWGCARASTHARARRLTVFCSIEEEMFSILQGLSLPRFCQRFFEEH